MRHRFGAFVLTLVAALGPSEVLAHDASAWGGLFRSRDAGSTWLHVNPGSFVAGAMALAISPIDPHHLLLATDSGLSRSRNGGRDWVVEAADILPGPAFAAAFDADGVRALASGASAIFAHDGDRWRRVRSPTGSTPARALVSGSLRGRVYLAGWTGVYRSEDWGRAWVSISQGLPTEQSTALVVPRSRPDDVYVVAGGRFWVSTDAGRSWQQRTEGLPARALEAVTFDPAHTNRLWAAAGGQVFRTDDQGRGWQPLGGPVPDRPVVIQAMAVFEHVIVLATHRGLYRSADNGERWALWSDNLPAHLDAGLIVRDPRDSHTIYAGFAVTPRAELLRRAAEHRSDLDRLAPLAAVGGVAFLALSLLAAAAVVRRLTRTQSPVSRSLLR